MKNSKTLLLALALGLAVLAGCKKAQAPHTTQDYYGVKVDWAKLNVFTNAAPEVQGHVTMLRRAFRYSQFPQAIVELDQLANDATLAPDQKNVVNEFLEQTKQIITNAPPPSGQ